MPLPKQQFLPSSANAELAGRAADLKTGGLPELLRKAGKEMYDNPVVNTAISLTPGAGDIQSGLEALASAREGDWTGAALNGVGVLPFVPALRTVWHGSPHKFNAFDMSKIGTGEGAQAYGHGVYLADAPETAKAYRDTLSKSDKQFYVDGNRVDPEMLDAFKSNVLHAKANGRSKQDYLDQLELDRVSPSAIQKMSKAWDEIGSVTAKDVLPENASLYKVDLPDEHIAKMLDWDAPLSQQPHAMEAFRAHVSQSQRNPDAAMALLEGKTGGEAYQTLAGKNPGLVSQGLREAGLPGLKYLDQGSRGAGEGTRNYVVFDDKIPKILERNGNPLVEALREAPADAAYRGVHKAPTREFGAPLHDLTGGGQFYPDDIYSPNAARFYGHGGDQVALDKETARIVQALRNKPDAMVDIYRAVPDTGDIAAINAGDWVTVNPNYAKRHGESVLEGKYKILSSKVPAKHVYTNADSIHEFGYDPDVVEEAVKNSK